MGVLLLSGCATSGPNYLYTAADNGAAVQAIGPERQLVPHAVGAGERVLGLAYDFNTDHLFLRIAPAQVIRVVERPSGKILREMPLAPELRTEESLPRTVPEDTPPADQSRAPGREQPGADLAIRSSDRHLFAVAADRRSVVELTLFGATVQRLELRGLDTDVGGLAFDQKANRLLVLTRSGRIGAVGPDRLVTYYVTLPANVRPVSLGYDSDTQHFFVPLADGSSVGEFDAAGKRVNTFATGPVDALAAGPRSFVRVF